MSNNNTIHEHYSRFKVRASRDRHTAALSARERPANNLHHYYSSRGQNSLPRIPPPAPKLPSKNDQLPELGATGRNRKIRPNRWLLNASRTEMAVELSLARLLRALQRSSAPRRTSPPSVPCVREYENPYNETILADGKRAPRAALATKTAQLCLTPCVGVHRHLEKSRPLGAQPFRTESVDSDSHRFTSNNGMRLTCFNSFNSFLSLFVPFSHGHTYPSLSETLSCYDYLEQ
ncbi:hypothetical protein DPX16_14297 [Anabarilius grahami]|uniref:Uncharacterized protein n=1 Tax=Anabarilius grahami TaxID=495550 RepID=A0A3N0Y6V4_ANAGA|nr:hypothetical protein DPX16_14297 [Anabarilius grahami]